MNLRTAAQQALEALEYTNKYGFVLADYEGPMEQAITALRATLAQQEAQQEQEPVEIKPPNPEGATQCIVRWMAETSAGWVGAWDREALERFTAHPPRREWVSLTEEDFPSIRDGDTAFRSGALWAERLLKERNT
jgi:hypothetical protein